MRLIESHDDLAEGRAHLAAACPVWARTLPELDLPLRRRSDGFGAILEAVLGQQISVARAQSMMARLQAAGLTQPDAIRAAGAEALRGCGLSGPKARYLTAIAAAQPDWLALRDASDAEVVATLTALPGIGPWTAEIYLAFALGRADAFPTGDLALQEAARLLYDLPARPDARGLQQLAEPWRPWRGVAARALWAYYARAKGRQGVSSQGAG
ncbi:DNA-3-methyladenine glycosylase family protein [Paracoccus jeotgali]|uniref:DNA-3-methyladenine glycosylase II n=1 Tax=Paracoccus jeotgali TaxID=2065379 RepID=A0A2K9MJV0_9RHOB|nr:DNA-3-methyladenine glycosylase [Paracoccus jeotgali]AUM74835.1 3-methyladenine DNA glycosylase [Paracoccus jeotgali]